MLSSDLLRMRRYPLFHLQWFAAEDEGRTEPPSEQKIRRAREEGKVAKSTDLNTSLILFCAIITIGLLSRYYSRVLTEMMQFFLARTDAIGIIGEQIFYRLMYRYFIRLFLPVLLVVFVAALFANVFQVGFLFTTKPIQPDLKRIAPRFGRFIQRVLLSPEARFNFFKSWTKLFIIGMVGVLNVLARYREVVNIINAPLPQSVGLVARIAFSLILQASIILLVFSFFDYQFQKYLHRESLKMTRQEVKEERKTQEGDPLVRSRLRQRMQSILTSNMVRNVPKADVVITNPTHYAVALEYDGSRMQAPTVLAKGADVIAQRIRALAQEHAVPLIENKPLARALFDEVDIGDSIPEKFYEAIVTILAEIYKLKRAPIGVG